MVCVWKQCHACSSLQTVLLNIMNNVLLNIIQGGDEELMIRKLIEGVVPIKLRN